LTSRIHFVQFTNLTTGWWLAESGSTQGWAPSAYLKEEIQAPAPAPVIRPTPPPPPPAAVKSTAVNGSTVRAKPTPPAPPAKRPAAGGRKPAPALAPRDSGMSLNGGSGSDSGRNTPTPSLAGGLAEALRARQSAMQKGRDEDDDW
jgi:myosin-1